MTGPERDHDDPGGAPAQGEQPVEGDEPTEPEAPDDPPGRAQRGLARVADIRFVDPDEDDRGDPSEVERRRNGRLLTIAIAVGGALVLAIAVVGVIAVRSYLDDTTSITAKMSLKYHAQYRSCLERSGDRGLCATRAEAACATDKGWSADSHRLDDIARICVFGDDARN